MIKDRDRNIFMSEEGVLRRWKKYIEELLNATRREPREVVVRTIEERNESQSQQHIIHVCERKGDQWSSQAIRSSGGKGAGV